MIFHGRLSDRNYWCRRRPRYLIFSQFSIYIVAKMRLPPGLCLGPHLGASSSPSWQTLGLTIAEGPTELRAPGPRYPTIRHCPKRIHRKRGRVCRCITANTRAICVADTIVRVNRCTPVIVAALIDYWLRTIDHRNNPVIDNNMRRFLFV